MSEVRKVFYQQGSGLVQPEAMPDTPLPEGVLSTNTPVQPAHVTVEVLASPNASSGGNGFEAQQMLLGTAIVQTVHEVVREVIGNGQLNQLNQPRPKSRAGAFFMGAVVTGLLGVGAVRVVQLHPELLDGNFSSLEELGQEEGQPTITTPVKNHNDSIYSIGSNESNPISTTSNGGEVLQMSGQNNGYDYQADTNSYEIDERVVFEWEILAQDPTGSMYTVKFRQVAAVGYEADQATLEKIQSGTYSRNELARFLVENHVVPTTLAATYVSLVGDNGQELIDIEITP